MTQTTRLAPQRRAGRQQGFRNALQRLTMTLMLVMLTAMTAWAVNVDLSTLTGNYEAQNGDVLTGTLGANVKITIANSATVTLSDVSINADGTLSGEYAGLTCKGNAIIFLSGANTVRGFNSIYPGIHIATNGTLTIQGDGSLDAIGGGAGIGGGYNIPCGNIVINGGTINATGGTLAAGIGGGYNAACGNITIGTGITQLTANGQGTNSIGAGNNGTCGTVTVCGVEGAITEKPFTCFHYTVHFDANNGTGTAMADQSFIYGIAQNLTANTYTREGFTFLGWNTAANGAGTAYANQESVSKIADVTSGSTVTLYAQWNIPGLTYNATGNYFEIPDATALNTLAAFVNAGHSCEGVTFKQTNPITLTGNFTPIGEHKSPGYYMFSGTYDGNNQTISGLNVNGDYSYAGLFGYLYKATVKKVRLVSPVISSSTNNSGEYFAGALVGRTSSTKEASECSTITNCIVISPSVGFSNEGGTPYVGAIVGDIRGSYDQVTNCYFYDTQHTYTAIGDADAMSYFPSVAQAHRITLGNFVLATNDISITNHPERGFTYNNVNYYRDGFQIELSSTNLVAETENGYCVGFSVDGGQTWLDGNILTVGTDCHDATVTAGTNVPLDWATITDGTAGAPYLIKNKEQMELLARRVNNGKNDYSNKYFELKTDLLYDPDVTNNYTAIGTADHPFRGNFDGAGKVISNVNISKATADYQGLFGYTDGATISNIQFTDSRVTGKSQVGGIVGYANGGNVENCLLFRDVVTSTTTGGVIIGGSNSATLTANFHNASTYNNVKIGVSTSEGDVSGAFGARKIILGENIAVDKNVTDPANGFPYGSQKYFRDGLELTASYTGTLSDQYSVSFALDDTPLENGVLTVTPDCDGKTIKPVFSAVKEPKSITYMKADGTTATHDALPLDGNETTLEAGKWYYMDENITYNHTLNLQDGDVTIILCDGKSMNFGESNNKQTTTSIDGYNSNLTIYGQSLDATTAGTINVFTKGVHSSILTEAYMQHSGKVNIVSGDIAIQTGSFTLAGGSLTINSTNSWRIFSSSDLTIAGGVLDVRTNASQSGALYSAEGDIVLGWTNTTDRIYATSYQTGNGSVRIADGQAMQDADNASTFFMGAVANPNDIATKTLKPAVCFTFNCGTGAPTVDPVFAAPGTVIAQPATPVWEGHNFQGWYTADNIGPNGTAYNFTQPAYTSQTLYAKWTGQDYTITYNLAGGELPTGNSNPTTFNVESTDITLVNPVRDYYTFTGWTGTGLTVPTTTVTISTGSMGNRTYTATWTPIVYPIHYNLDGGTEDVNTPNPTTYTVESADIKLNNPTRQSYRFLGWTGTGLDALSDDVNIPTGSHGERTYTAHWQECKDFTTCTVTVPNQQYNNGYFIGYKFEGTDHGGVVVRDADNNVLTYGTDYIIGDFVSLDYPDNQDPCTHVGEHCQVTIRGAGEWVGEMTVNFEIIPLSANGTWGSNLTWSYSGGELTISGTGAMADKTNNTNYPWIDYAGSITNIIIGNGITSIGTEAFGGQIFWEPTYSKLTTVSLPNTLTTIGNQAFYYSTSLTLTIPVGVTSFGDYAFYGVASVTATFNGEVTIGNDAFPSNATVTIASGLSLHNGTEELSGTITDMSKLNGKTLTPPTYDVTANENPSVTGEFWSTFYHPTAGYQVPSNTTAYIAAVNGSSVTLTEVTDGIIPANTAVVLKATSGNFDLTRTGTASTFNFTGNELKGGSTVADGKVAYTLAAKSGVVGFYKFAGAALNPNKAHLEITPTNAPEYLGFDENTTAINEHEFNESHELSGEWYDLQGRKIANGQKPNAKGLYIVNGRKIVIK